MLCGVPPVEGRFIRFGKPPLSSRNEPESNLWLVSAACVARRALFFVYLRNFVYSAVTSFFIASMTVLINSLRNPVLRPLPRPLPRPLYCSWCAGCIVMCTSGFVSNSALASSLHSQSSRIFMVLGMHVTLIIRAASSKSGFVARPLEINLTDVFSSWIRR